VVSLVRVAVQWLIPDTSRHLHDKIQKEEFIINERIIVEERKRAKSLNSGEQNAMVSNAMLPRKRKSSAHEEIALSNRKNV
jgi:hypothetical protein